MVLGYDEMRWASELHYHEQDPTAAVELFKMLRAQSYKLIRDLPESVWANTVRHSEKWRDDEG